MSTQTKRLTKHFKKLTELNRMIDDGCINQKIAARKEKLRLSTKQYGRSTPTAGAWWNPNGKQLVRG